MDKRTDEEILAELTTGLLNNSRFDTSGIDVRVTNGEVFLSGFIDSWESKRSARDIAANVSGVVKVHNDLEIRALDEA